MVFIMGLLYYAAGDGEKGQKILYLSPVGSAYSG